MLAFEQTNWRNLVLEMARNLGDKVPTLRDRLGQRDLVRAVHQSANIAYSQFRLREDEHINAFVSYAARLGIGFTDDIAVFWAGDIMTDNGFVLMSERMSFLETNMMNHFYVAFGESMPWVPNATYQHYSKYLTSPHYAMDSRDQAVALLEWIWPERATLCEFRQLGDFCAEAGSLAQAYGLTGTTIQNRYALMAFILGARFDMDPFHPWAATVLQEPALEPAERMAKLEKAALTHAIYPWIRETATKEDES